MSRRVRTARLGDYDWLVANYYACDVKPPKQPGGLAIETVHKGLGSRDVEIAASKSRADLGRIVVTEIHGSGSFTLLREGDEWVRHE